MNRGFTLVELLVVITILAVLAGTALPFVQSYVEESRIAKTKADLEEISRALVVYETREGEYPDTDVKLLAGRYLNKTPIDPWGSNYVVDKDAGTVYSKGPDRLDGSTPNDADNIAVSYQPPLALVSVKWVDRNQNGVIDADNVPDQLQFTFSRKLNITSAVCSATNLGNWFLLDTDGVDNPTNSPAPVNTWVQANDAVSTVFPATPDILTNEKDMILSLKSPFTATGITLGKAFLVISTSSGNATVGDTDDLEDKNDSLALSSQKVLIIPQ